MKSLVTAMALVAAAGAANAQSVEFRIRERQNQTQWNLGQPTAAPLNDGILNYTVQGRVVGGSAGSFLGNFSFDVVASGEADANGLVQKAAISNADGSYNTSASQYNANATVGRGGLSAVYSYLAGISPNFNGLINLSGGTFTNTAGSQEIGLVTGSPSGSALLLLADTGGTGNPDTYSGSGTTAPVDGTLANSFLGANGNWVSLYNFNYTVSNTTTDRFITFSLANVAAQIGTGLQLSNGVWGPVQANATATSGTNAVNIIAIPAPASAALLGLGGLVATRRRRVA
jgi:hypothetical protein